MGKITALRPSGGRGKRVKVFVDGKLAFSLDAEMVAKEGLQAEQGLSAERSEALTREDHLESCRKAALSYLSYRPRSEAELREKLRRCDFDGEALETVISQLKQRGLVDDIVFAQFWKENREAFSPRSQRLTRLELRQKGIANEVIDEVVETVDDEDSAYRAAQGRARNLAKADYQEFYRRLGGYLKRRGFSYRLINQTVERLWRDQGSGGE